MRTTLVAPDGPIVGRGAELALIDAAAAAGEPGGFLLLGPMGVGKSRLMREALAHARAAHRDTEWVTATRAAAAIPFGAVCQLFPADRQLGTERYVLLRKTVERAARRSTGLPMVLGVDDAHLLDDESAALIHQLVLYGGAFLIATALAGEPASDAISALWKDGLATRMTVRPLADAAVDELLERMLGSGLEGVTRAQIRNVTAGNPLLLRELIAGAVEDEALVQREGLWRWHEGPRYGTSVRELVDARLAVVGEAARTVLEVVACAEPLPVTVLQRVMDAGALDARAVEAAERRGIIAAESSGRRQSFRPAHPICGEVVRSELPVAKRQQIWRWLADATDGQPARRRGDAIALATWRLRAGAAQAPSALLSAARLAATTAELALAEQFARAAADAGGGPAASRMLAQVLTWRGRPLQAAEVLAALPPELDAGADTTAWTAAHAWHLYWRGGDGALARQELDRVTPVSGTARAALDTVKAWLLLFDGHCDKALDALSAIVAAAEDGTAWPFPLAAAALANALHGRADVTLALADRGLALAAADGDRLWGAVTLAWARCIALLVLGRAPDAESAAERGYAAAVGQVANRRIAAGWAACHGRVALYQGRPVAAQAALREAAACLSGRDAYQFARYIYAGLACAAALTGDLPSADEWLRRCDAHQADPNKLFEPWIELDRAWVMAGRREFNSAARQARHAASLAQAAGQHPMEAIALYDVARLGDPASVLPRLTDLAAQVDGPLAAILANAAAALAASDASGLDDATSQLSNFGLLLHAAEAATVAARLHREQGHPALSIAARERVIGLAGRCEGARTPLLASDNLSSVLTPREREIAFLAAAGLATKTIAADLSLSDRTVNNHLGRVYAKAGVSSRSELALIFRQ